jgi:multicomponent Na+:H+ antiporter subunit D
MSASLPPALILICGGLLLPLLSRRLKQAALLLLPLWCLWVVHTAPEGALWRVELMGYDLVLGQVDRLSRVFGYIFSLIAFLGNLFALQAEDDLEHVSALVYAGSALGVTFAGDLVSLYLFWEVMAVASAFIVLCGRTPEAYRAGFRYVMVHLAGGLVLLAGIIWHLDSGGPLEVGLMGLSGPASWLVFGGVALNAAIPPLHPWLKDAYPEASPFGAVFLSAFTTKSAVYVMARLFPGAEVLIYLGAAMTVYPIFFAVLENNLRRVLSYSLVNQVGYMMVGVGIGTQLALNGTVSHAFCHILYKALLFMSMGSVLHVTGKIKATELGGLYRYMPLTAMFCMVGAASISGFPLFSGFVSKSMIVSAAGAGGLVLVWFLLEFASVGVIDHAGIKVPFFSFFSHDSGLEAHEPPWNMLAAMGVAAFLCLAIGVHPQPLYAILPYPVDYAPYTAGHVVGMLQLLLFGALAFTLLLKSGRYPAEIRAVNLDFDWFYRKGGAAFARGAAAALDGLNAASDRLLAQGLSRALGSFFRRGPQRLVGLAARPFLAGAGAERKRARLQRALDNGALPLGLSGLAAAAMLILLYLLA